LLARTDASGSTYYHADAAGNITAMADTSGNVVARYLYDPYGNLLGKWGALADANRYRFSSKEIHPNSGLYYYGFRFYEPNLQRWLNRDPIGERGGVNLYGFVGNRTVDQVDLLGLQYGPGWTPGMPNGIVSGDDDIGPPPTWLTFVPMFGPASQAGYDFTHGHPVWGVVNEAMAFLDAIPLRSASGAVSKGAWKFGSHTWDATRKWLTKCGWREFKGQEMHHWAVPQNGWGEFLPKWFKNQPWNLSSMPSAAFHDALHGAGPDAFNFGERLWYGTPDWLAAGMASTAGREANWAFGPDNSGDGGDATTALVPLQPGNSMCPVMPGLKP
jgi:RHS repeat-associated protein